MERTITPEILDHLHPEDPRAVRSRKDLVRVNRLMGNAQFQARALGECLQGKTKLRILEIGCGDGSFMLEVLKLARRSGGLTGELLLLDQQSVVQKETLQKIAELGWTASFVQADLFQWLPKFSQERFDLAACNLFLHHFQAELLQRLFQAISNSCDAFIATEPRRNTFCLAVTHCLGLIGCNGVTRHDAPVSIHAGFRGAELQNLWPVMPNRAFQFEEARRGLFTHFFSARALAPK
ncbi:MAG: class I SAM-dependent methyltransferase [Verrucomicrobiales bacterium]